MAKHRTRRRTAALVLLGWLLGIASVIMDPVGAASSGDQDVAGGRPALSSGPATKDAVLHPDQLGSQLNPEFQRGHQPQTGILTPIDILSTSPSHTTFLHLLQLAKLVPVLNYGAERVGNGKTVFAPTNEAWEAWMGEKGYSLGTEGLRSFREETEVAGQAGTLRDNIHFELRQHLLYHILNFTLPLSPSNSSPGSRSSQTTPDTSIQTVETLLFPHRSPLPPSDSPPTGSPWLPSGGDGDLGGKGQQLRVTLSGETQDEGPSTQSSKAEVDVLWVGGSAAWREGDSERAGSSVWTGWPKRNGSNPTPGTGGGDGNEPEPEPDKDRKPMVFADQREGLDRKSMTGARVRFGRSIQQATNGYVIGLNKVLDLPPNLDWIIDSHPSLSYLHSLLHPSSFASMDSSKGHFEAGLIPNFAKDPHLTIFAPTTKAFHAKFDHLERTYLEGGWGREGVNRILGAMIMRDAGARVEAKGDPEPGSLERDGSVGWRSFWAEREGLGERSAMTVGGDTISVAIDPAGAMAVNDQAVIDPDIFASNGVLHIVDSVILPTDFVLLNSAEKMLLTLNATRFVSLMRAANLSELYTAANAGSWTLLAPTDEVLERPSRWHSLLENGLGLDQSGLAMTPDLKALLQYHVIPGKLLPDTLKDETLLQTELQPPTLKGQRQRLLAHVEALRDEQTGGRPGGRHIRFGDAVVLMEPVVAGDSIIYLISDILDPPTDLVQTAVSDIKLSTFVASLFASGMDKLVKRTPGMTYFAPTNNAFAELGLAMRWLLSAEQGAKDDLRKVIRYHAVRDTIYASDMTETNLTLETTGGEEITMRNVPCDRKSCAATGNRSISLSAPYRLDSKTGTWLPIDGRPRSSEIIRKDILTETGVMHVVDSVALPPNLHISIGKLMEGAKAGVMMDLMDRAGMGWLLDGMDRPGNETVGVARSRDADGWELSPAYTLLVPRDEAWAAINVTRYLHSPNALRELLHLHIIPTPPGEGYEERTAARNSIASSSRPLGLADDRVFHTLLSAESKYGSLVVTEEARGRGWLIGINGAYGGDAGRNFARVLESGKATPVWRSPGDNTGSSLRVDTSEPGGPGQTNEPYLSSGGGIMLLDTVLEPFEPSWLAEHGWTLAGWVTVGIASLAVIVLLILWFRGRRIGRIQLKSEDEPLEGEEEF